jgi:phenylpropionate dioxygenase-like ring-hydroxylating dioxygenase large terminal subunit
MNVLLQPRASARRTGLMADAVCPHLGANLGHGKVVGNNLQCAFHGWRYAADGHCVSTPGQDRPPLRQLRQYAAQEKWGLVWLFNADQPLWDLPEPDADLLPLVMPDAKVPTHPHLMIMNGLDGAHFEPLHHMHATSPPQYSTPDSYRVSLDLQGQWTSPVLGRLTGTQSKAIEAQFTTLAHIWSPPILQDFVVRMTGTGLLPYIRPVEERQRPSGLDEMRAHRPYRLIGIMQPPLG